MRKLFFHVDVSRYFISRNMNVLAYRLFIPVLLLAAGALPCLRLEAQPGENDAAEKVAADTSRVSLEAEGKIVRTISIVLRDVFEGDNLPGLYQTVNSLKVSTREYVVRRELVVREGKPYSEILRKESERRLRSLGYLRRIRIIPTVDGDFVDVRVEVQDTWTFIPQLGYSSSSGRKRFSAGVSESNLLGLGKRVEVAYEDNENREIIETVYDDNRFNGKRERLLTAFFDREDGYEGIFYYGRPYRTLLDPFSWYINYETSDIVGRLFEDGDESYIFREHKQFVNLRYSHAQGDPERSLRRYSFGYQFLHEEFDQADESDYEDLDLDPNEVSNDSAFLAPDRRFSGPSFSFEFIQPRYIPMNYIDRFERIEDYNVGDQYDIGATLAPEFLGSRDDQVLLSFNRSHGWQFRPGNLFRIEGGIATRAGNGGFENSLIRGELKFYEVLGDVMVGDLFLGKHTLALGFFADYGSDLDRERQFTLGGDNALRGYRARAFTGDKRTALNIEDRVHIVDDLYRLVSIGAAAFVDVGGATYESFGNLFQNDLYADVGVGLRFAFPRSTGGRVLRVDLAVPLREAEDGTDRFELRLSVAGGQVFSSRLRSESFGPERANVEIGFDR